MPTKSKTAVATDYQMEAEKERSIAIGLAKEGKPEEAEIHYGAARYFADKAEYARRSLGSSPIVMGEANDRGVIAWRAKNTLRDPDQVALDASAERKELLLGPSLDVSALGLDAADTIDARNSLEKMLAHQLALAHKLVFDLANKATQHTDPITAIKWMNLSARMMDTFQGGLLAIQKLRSGNSQAITVQHINVQGGQTVVAGTMQTGGQAEAPGGADKK